MNKQDISLELTLRELWKAGKDNLPIDTSVDAAKRNIVEHDTRIREFEEALKDEKTHSITSDFCSSEWKNDVDELKDLLRRAVAIIETVNPGSSEEKDEQFLFLEDAKVWMKKEPC